MKVYNSGDPQVKPTVAMLIYGQGGVGKTTFAATAPKPLIVDCENGAKYFGLRGINVDVAQVSEWGDLEGLMDQAKSGKYETIVIDPIGELMEKLRRYMVQRADKKLVQSDGSPSMAGWGWLKDRMRATVKLLRDSGLNMILVAHVDEKQDEDRLVKRPMIMTKLSDELVNMVDIVGFMTVVQDAGEEKRVIVVDPSSDKYVAKDRSGMLGKWIPPNFGAIVKAVQGTETFKWSKPKPPTKDVSPTVKQGTTEQQIEEAAGKAKIETVFKALLSAIAKSDAAALAGFDKKMKASKLYTDEQRAVFAEAIAARRAELAEKTA